MKTSLLLTALVIAVSLSVAPFALANLTNVTLNTIAGTWSISYYTDAGHTTPWTNYASNGDSQVGSGVTIYAVITVTGSTANKYVWVEIDGGNSPYPAPQYIGQLNGSGGGTLNWSWTNNLSDAWLVNLCTVPIKIALGDSSTSAPTNGDFDGNILDHYVPGDSQNNYCQSETTTSTTSTLTYGSPEFESTPLALMLGTIGIIGALTIVRLKKLTNPIV